MTKEEIKETIRKHQLWLKNEGGERADFRNVNLYRADLTRADLTEANLYRADLTRADLTEANLTEANLYRANLTEANLYRADLTRAELAEADLARADLTEANLARANLYRADLTEANLYRADLTRAELAEADLARADLTEANLARANLYRADLTEANLYRADLTRAELAEADLTGIKTNYLTIGIHPAPEGELIGWGKKDGKLVKLLIPAEAKRSCATTRKHRAEFAKVLWIEDGLPSVTVVNKYGETVYAIGQTVYCHQWEEDRWQECAGGIHFFLSRAEAEAWE